MPIENLKSLLEEEKLTILLRFCDFFPKDRKTETDEITIEPSPSLTIPENPNQSKNLNALPYLNAIEEMLMILASYVDLANKTIGSKKRESFKYAIVNILTHLNTILESLNELQNTNEDKKWQTISKIPTQFSCLAEAIESIETMLKDEAGLISRLATQQRKAQTYQQALTRAKENISTLKAIQYSLYAAAISAIATSVVVGLLTALPYIAIPLSIVLIIVVASEIARRQKSEAEEKVKTNTEALTNMPKTFSAYLQTDFKPSILQIVRETYAFFKQKDLNSNIKTVDEFLSDKHCNRPSH